MLAKFKLIVEKEMHKPDQLDIYISSKT